MHLFGAYQERAEGKSDKRVPHVFQFLPRGGGQNHPKADLNPIQKLESSLFAALPDDGRGIELSERLPVRMRSCGQQSDVFAIMKMYMSDRQASQAPLLCWPTHIRGATEEFCRQINTTNKTAGPELSPQRAAEVLELADAIERHYPNLRRAVTYYRSLVQGVRQVAYPRLDFIRNGPRPQGTLALLLGMCFLIVLKKPKEGSLLKGTHQE